MGIKSEKGKEITQKELERGLEGFSKYVEKCKQESRKPVSLQQFFRKYDPETLQPAIGIPPLRKYVQRYYKEIKKLEKKKTSQK